MILKSKKKLKTKKNGIKENKTIDTTSNTTTTINTGLYDTEFEKQILKQKEPSKRLNPAPTIISNEIKKKRETPKIQTGQETQKP